MGKKFPDWARIISAFIIFFSSIGIYISVSTAGHNIINAGEAMVRLRSVGGTSLAEAYYQLHGEIYIGIGNALANGVAVILITGILLSLWLVYPVLSFKKAADAQSHPSPQTDPIPPQREAQSTEGKNSQNTISCTACGSPLPAEAAFCSTCGCKIEQNNPEERCPTCGNTVAHNAAFCVKCGYHLEHTNP